MRPTNQINIFLFFICLRPLLKLILGCHTTWFHFNFSKDPSIEWNQKRKRNGINIIRKWSINIWLPHENTKHLNRTVWIMYKIIIFWLHEKVLCGLLEVKLQQTIHIKNFVHISLCGKRLGFNVLSPMLSLAIGYCHQNLIQHSYFIIHLFDYNFWSILFLYNNKPINFIFRRQIE